MADCPSEARVHLINREADFGVGAMKFWDVSGMKYTHHLRGFFALLAGATLAACAGTSPGFAQSAYVSHPASQNEYVVASTPSSDPSSAPFCPRPPRVSCPHPYHPAELPSK